MKRKHLLIIVAAVMVLVAALSLFPVRAKNQQDTQAVSPILRPVAVARVRPAPILQTLVLSGEFKPFQQVDVHAKVAGYIRRIYVDVGDKVKKGQILAVLEVPELSAQLLAADAAVRRAQDSIRRAQNEVARDKSSHQATHLDYKRLKQASLARPGLIAQQELDDAFAKDQSAEAQVDAAEASLSAAGNELGIAQADQKRLQAMANYTRIISPFDGVVTKRYADTGALVQAGTASSTQAMPVVTIAQYDKLRLVLPVPEDAVPAVHLGSEVDVHVLALHRHFVGKVARFADALDLQTRTMHTEVDVDNPKGTLVDGMYADVTLVLHQLKGALTVPIQAVTRNGDQASVLVVNPEDRIELRPVQLGMEGPNRVEVVSGLSSGDQVVIGNASDFHPGEKVQPKPFQEAANTEEF
ncbi:MAG TPA: efflux RND transporter periplasmic adaptor subunit [Terriglobales bacterium]|nr:efflux RND transporter periplasmic adaptor subunit [Terriglobales bacterium]